MPMTPEQRRDRASKAGRAAAASMTPEQRKARASKASLAAAIATIARRAPELTEDQIALLRPILAGGAR